MSWGKRILSCLVWAVFLNSAAVVVIKINRQVWKEISFCMRELNMEGGPLTEMVTNTPNLSQVNAIMV